MIKKILSILVVILAPLSCTMLDFEAPIVEITSHVDGETLDSTELIQGTASDNLALKSVRIKVDNGNFQEVEGQESWFIMLNVGSAGPHFITVEALDWNQNKSYAMIRVMVSDDSL